MTRPCLCLHYKSDLGAASGDVIQAALPGVAARARLRGIPDHADTVSQVCAPCVQPIYAGGRGEEGRGGRTLSDSLSEDRSAERGTPTCLDRWE